MRPNLEYGAIVWDPYKLQDIQFRFSGLLDGIFFFFNKNILCHNLEYGAIVWDPYKLQDIQSIEKIQRQAARYIKK